MIMSYSFSFKLKTVNDDYGFKDKLKIAATNYDFMF